MTQSGKGRKQSRKTTTRSSSKARSTRAPKRQEEEFDYSLKSELVVILVIAQTIFLFLCNFGICGDFGNAVSSILFGLFGITAYVAPLVMLGAVAIGIANFGSSASVRKIVSGIVIFFVIGIIADLITGRPQSLTKYDIAYIYSQSSAGRNGGGFFAGSLAYIIYKYLSFAGTALLLLVIGIASVVVFTEQSFVGGLKKGGRKIIERTREDAANYRDYAERRREKMEQRRAEIEEERRLAIEQKEDEKILRMEKNVRGVMLETDLKDEEGNGNPLQYPCLEDPRDGEAWWAAVYGVAQSRTRLK